MAMRPCSASTSRLSDSSLTMMMVLEKVSATAQAMANSTSSSREWASWCSSGVNT